MNYPDGWPRDGRARRREHAGKTVLVHPDREPLVLNEDTKKWDPYGRELRVVQ